MSNRIEQGTFQREGLTRREALRRFPVFAAAALVALTTGCDGVYPPSGTGPRGDGRQAVPEPQVDEEAARNVSVLYMVALGAGLFFLRNIR